MEEKKILVLGGKGKTGRKVAERLTQCGQFVRIGSRSEKPSFDDQAFYFQIQPKYSSTLCVALPFFLIGY